MRTVKGHLSQSRFSFATFVLEMTSGVDGKERRLCTERRQEERPFTIGWDTSKTRLLDPKDDGQNSRTDLNMSVESV